MFCLMHSSVFCVHLLKVAVAKYVSVYKKSIILALKVMSLAHV